MQIWNNNTDMNGIKSGVIQEQLRSKFPNQ